MVLFFRLKSDSSFGLLGIFLLLVFVLASCSDSSQPPLESDSDITEVENDASTDSDPLDEEEPSLLCEPDAFRCQPGSNSIVNRCTENEWRFYRDCADLGRICLDGDCATPGDIDEEEIEPDEDTDIQDNDPIENDTDEEREEGSTIVECPGHPEMVLVDDYCVDRWEAVAMEYEDCSGTAYGQYEDDYPDGFPKCVDCDENGECIEGGNCPREDELGDQTTPVYACSLENVLPSRYITWLQARKACLNSNKRLCSMDEWIRACEGSQHYLFPYGNVFIEDACHTGMNDPIETGQYNQCISQDGVYDQIGNLAEWSATTFIQGSSNYNYLGCYWVCTYSDHLKCNPDDPTQNRKSYTSWEFIGFRCCMDH